MRSLVTSYAALISLKKKNIKNMFFRLQNYKCDNDLPEADPANNEDNETRHILGLRVLLVLVPLTKPGTKIIIIDKKKEATIRHLKIQGKYNKMLGAKKETSKSNHKMNRTKTNLYQV